MVVEDDYLIAQALTEELRERGFAVIGPVGTVREGVRVASENAEIGIALLDVNLRGEMAFSIADVLKARNIPFAFTTGYDDKMIPDRHAGAPCLQKPASLSSALDLLLADAPCGTDLPSFAPADR